MIKRDLSPLFRMLWTLLSLTSALAILAETLGSELTLRSAYVFLELVWGRWVSLWASMRRFPTGRP